MNKNAMARRRFLRDAAAAVGLGAVTATQASEKSRAAKYEYNIDRFKHVDPALVHYELIHRFPIGKPEPRRLTIGSDGRLYIAAGNSVVLLSDRGAVLDEIALSGGARSVGVGADGQIHVGVKDHIEVFDAKRKRIAVWDAPHGRPLLTGIAVAENDVFVADAGNRIVWRYDRSGKLVRRIGEKDAQRNIPGFVVPSPFFDLELGADGLLRVANPGRHRIETYTFDGDLELSWGKRGAAIEAFCGCCNPCNIALLSDGRVLTFEKGLPRAKIYNATGEMESVVAPPAALTDPTQAKCSLNDCTYGGLDGAIDTKGQVFVLDLVGAHVQVFARKQVLSDGARPQA